MKGALLIVTAPDFTAGAIWERHPTGWNCVQCAPIIKWMRDMQPQAVKNYLERKGWEYQFMDGTIV